MSFKKLSFALASIIVVAGITTLLQTNSSKNSENDDDTAGLQQTTTQTSALPNQQAGSIEEAKKSLSFSPLLPSVQINGEKLTGIKVGTSSGMIDDSDTIYLSFTDNEGTLFKISQSTKQFNYPTEVEKYSLLINGEQVEVSYYKLAEVEDSSLNSANSDVSSPVSYIFWNMDGVMYEISEFGRVGKQQLLDLAGTFK